MHNELNMLRAERERLMNRLDNSGGRGVLLAEEIDALDRRIAVIESGFDVEAFIDGYIDCILWCDALPRPPRTEHNEPDYDWAYDNSGGLTGRDLAPGTRAEIVRLAQIVDFIEHHIADLADYCAQVGPWKGVDDRGYAEDPAEARAGHDFYLSRAGHGTGFWDRGLGDLGDRLHAAAQGYGSPDDHMLYERADGTVGL